MRVRQMEETFPGFHVPDGDLVIAGDREAR
jgi:hypothetical protein